jgi:hypothetical protein
VTERLAGGIDVVGFKNVDAHFEEFTAMVE